MRKRTRIVMHYKKCAKKIVMVRLILGARGEKFNEKMEKTLVRLSPNELRSRCEAIFRSYEDSQLEWMFNPLEGISKI